MNAPKPRLDNKLYWIQDSFVQDIIYFYFFFGRRSIHFVFEFQIGSTDISGTQVPWQAPERWVAPWWACGGHRLPARGRDRAVPCRALVVPSHRLIPHSCFLCSSRTPFVFTPASQGIFQLAVVNSQAQTWCKRSFPLPDLCRRLKHKTSET